MGITVSGTPSRKSFMSPDELIKKLVNKGVTFEYQYTCTDALSYLKKNNNFYKLYAYRKNFEKNEDGTYINLDFAYLVDLGVIDMLFRYQVMRMALDIEHFEKVKLLSILKNKNDDGYATLASYKAFLETQSDVIYGSRNKLEELNEEIDRNKCSIYCQDMIEHIQPGQEMPVWVFLEVITFGRFRSFLEFCAKKFGDTPLLDEAYRLKSIKSIRNAAGHSNCILNDLSIALSKEENSTHSLNKNVLKKIKRLFPSFTSTLRDNEPDFFQNDRLKEIATLFYVHSRILPSDAMREHYKEELSAFVKRMNTHLDDYYRDNDRIRNCFLLIQKIIEAWY